MSAQTTYATSISDAYAGLVVQQDSDCTQIVSKTAYGSVINFGVVVSRSGDAKATLGGSGTGIGVTIRSLDREGTKLTGAIQYAVGDSMAVLRKGYIWVVIAKTGVPGNALYYVNSTGLISVGTAGGGQTDLTGCTLETTVATNGDLGLIRVDL